MECLLPSIADEWSDDMYILKVDSIQPNNNDQINFMNNNSYQYPILNENETLFINQKKLIKL